MKTTFVHIADLHLGNTCWPSVIRKGYPSSDELKGQCLLELADFIRAKEPDFLFASGDITECHRSDGSDDVLEYACKLLAPVQSACNDVGAAIIGIPGDHDPPLSFIQNYIPWVHGFGEIVQGKGIRIGCLGVRPKQVGLMDDFRSWEDEQLDVVLVHSDRIASSTFSRLGTKYVARGHIHMWSDYSSGNTTSIMPGHLYTYWDGNGKAWPTSFACGVIDGTQCHVEQHYYRNVPRTRRFYWDEDSEVYRLENLLPAEVADSLTTWEQQAKGAFIDLELSRPFDELESMAMRVVEYFSDDIFVTPRHKRGKIVNYASNIMADDKLRELFLSCCIRPTGGQ